MLNVRTFNCGVLCFHLSVFVEYIYNICISMSQIIVFPKVDLSVCLVTCNQQLIHVIEYINL